MEYGILSVGAYVPRLRLERSAIAAVHKWMAPSLSAGAKGRRAFCSFDEDAVTMAVEAARDCLSAEDRGNIETLLLASTTLPYADLSSAAVIAAALDLSEATGTLESTGSQRASSSALIRVLKAAREETLIIASDRPQATPASTQEMQMGAGAAALMVGKGELVARYLGSGTVTANFPDHVRAAENDDAYYWEERWIRDEGYTKIIPPAVNAAFSDAGVTMGDITHFVMPAMLRKGAEAVARQIGFSGKIADALDANCGNAGVAHAFLMLANVLETAAAGERILVLEFGQGADAIILEATGKRSAGRGVSGCLNDKLETSDYLRYLSFYDRIKLDWGMRAESAEKAALTNAWRASGQITPFKGGKCPKCGAVQFPQLPVCVTADCAESRDSFEQVLLADVPAKVLTYTADWLSYHPAPPLFVGFIQFTNGARLYMETCDVTADVMDVGLPVKMMFRIKRIDPRNGFRRYFWKASPEKI